MLYLLFCIVSPQHYTSNKAAYNDVIISNIWGFHSVDVENSALWLLVYWIALLIIPEVSKECNPFMFIGQDEDESICFRVRFFEKSDINNLVA